MKRPFIFATGNLYTRFKMYLARAFSLRFDVIQSECSEAFCAENLAVDGTSNSLSHYRLTDRVRGERTFVCFQSNLRINWPLTLLFCTCMGHSLPEIENQGYRSACRLRLWLRWGIRVSTIDPWSWTVCFPVRDVTSTHSPLCTTSSWRGSPWASRSRVPSSSERWIRAWVRPNRRRCRRSSSPSSGCSADTTATTQNI